MRTAKGRRGKKRRSRDLRRDNIEWRQGLLLQVPLGKPGQANLLQLELDSLVAPLESGLKVERKRHIESPLMFRMTKASGEVRGADDDQAAIFRDSVKFS